MRTPLGRCALLGALWLCCAGDAQAQDSPDPTVYDQAWRVFRDQFYDRGLRGLDWKAAGDRHRPKALRARTQREVHEAISDLIAELKSSHGEVIEAKVYDKFYDAEAKSRPVPQYGMKLTLLDEGYFISEVLHGSAASAAGVATGDRVIAIDEQPVDEDALLPVPHDSGLGGPRSYRVPCLDEGDRVTLELERFQRPKYGRYKVTIAASRWNEVEASRISRKVFTRGGFKLGYMRLYHVLSEDIVLYLEEFLAEGLQDADGFVLDIRGQGGLPALVNRAVDFFDPNVRGKPLWDRPVVALIDRSSRSAKEAMAYSWRERGIGPLVGTNTAGAFVGATFAKLKDGAWLMVPVMDMRSMTGGVVLEGVGVAPDVKVDVDLPWSQGVDAILERGLDTLIDRIILARRRGRVHGWY